MALSEAGKQWKKNREGLVLHLYDDGIKGGKVWKLGMKIVGHITIGRGHVCTPNEIAKYSGKTIDEAEADRLFDIDTQEAEGEVDKFQFPFSQPYQRDACVWLCYNAGSAPFRATLGKYLKRKNWSAAACEFVKWNKMKTPQGLVIAQGLIDANAELMVLFLTGKVVQR